MSDDHTMTRHRDIQNWVTDRQGIPAIARVRNRFGEVHTRLQLKFGKANAKPDLTGLDDGISPCSWTAWLAELDRQQLALKVSDREAEAFELVDRNRLS
ncbi:hypothetical protein VW29_03370 [Devosia limi DSM 17137]|uniref:Uncharacterized protein n=1 Tax=Devosia limi DSM 17137 TaxID=1121477 RepID=A0A0F5LV72_9HYPH|nr:hypothetical protein [Devosia limi]KKB86238.1 hypothetical protein VW29_03075 [Devosia limi DSM 17137]KKB86288.1 hypothetical protein VW29_03370 [Devosia limi DSM 17137]SHF14751.1 hypothetical protein SAMN02745223_01861 [Devosia limi DSM 17137]